MSLLVDDDDDFDDGMSWGSAGDSFSAQRKAQRRHEEMVSLLKTKNRELANARAKPLVQPRPPTTPRNLNASAYPKKAAAPVQEETRRLCQRLNEHIKERERVGEAG